MQRKNIYTQTIIYKISQLILQKQINKTIENMFICKKFTNIIRSAKYLNNTKFISKLRYNFTNYNQDQNDLEKMSFQQLMKINTQQSLNLAAQRYAKLEIQTLQQTQQILKLQQKIQSYPSKYRDDIQTKRQIKQKIQQLELEISLREKRLDKELLDLNDYGASKVAKEVLEISDALKKYRELVNQKFSSKGYPNQSHLAQCELTLAKLFDKYGIEQFDPINQLFNPNTQEVLFETPTTDITKVNYVVETMRTGFKIKGRLLRSARVGVYK